jgi:hypothetical protein
LTIASSLPPSALSSGGLHVYVWVSDVLDAKRFLNCILGLTKTPAVTANSFVTANGNNLVFYGDTTRRALLCRLDGGVERPELREFGFDPIETAKRYRPEYVVAALTILRAFFIAGRPQQATPLGSFTEWSSVVRDALIWLGCADPWLRWKSFAARTRRGLRCWP